jgi:adenosylhomocysteine nucleosidase
MSDQNTVVLISADSEWKAALSILAPAAVQSTPMGEVFHHTDIAFFHGGWGKVSAAASTQYVIDHFDPTLLINLGTCGGIGGLIERGKIILVTQTIIYDIYEQMLDPQAALDHYTTDLDLSWLPEKTLNQLTGLPDLVVGLMLSADRDIRIQDLPELAARHNARAADWESGSIAWVAVRNGIHCLILRGVSDLVDHNGGEAYRQPGVFINNTLDIMKRLLALLPGLLA